MSIDIVDAVALNIELQTPMHVADPVSLMDAGMNLTEALSLVEQQSTSSSSGNGEFLQLEQTMQPIEAGALSDTGSVDAGVVAPGLDTFIAMDHASMPAAGGEDQIDLGVGGDQLGGAENFYEPPTIGDDQPGYVEVYQPPIYVPDGFVAEDLYAVEFIHDYLTGELTIILHFSTDPLDHGGVSASGELDDGFTLYSPNSVAVEDGLTYLAPLEQNGSRCTVTRTTSTTQNSGSYTVNFNTGLVSGSRTSPSTSTTTTTTLSIQGTLVNGRCVVSSGR